MFESVNSRIGTVDVHVMDALYLNGNIANMINDNSQYFVIRITDETRIIYKDVKELFDKNEPLKEYEIVEIIINKKVKYSKAAKKKDTKKLKLELK